MQTNWRVKYEVRASKLPIEDSHSVPAFARMATYKICNDKDAVESLKAEMVLEGYCHFAVTPIDVYVEPGK